LAPGTPHALPPECVSFIREGTWKQGARFNSNEAQDLYQLGVFMYEALTDGWPFDARLTTEELLTAIQTVVPRAPHRLNPEVPEPLSRITLRLLEKRPQDRYPSTEALLQALWDAAKERSKKSWKVPLEMPAEGPAPMTQDEVEERRLHKLEAERRAQEAQQQQAQELSQAQALVQASAVFKELGVAALEEKDARRKQRWRRLLLGMGALLVGFVLLTASWMWLAPDTLAPIESEKGSSPVSTPRSSPALRTVAAWLCATLSIGCPAAQLRPLPGDCPPEAVKRMREMKLLDGAFAVVLDHLDPDGTPVDDGTYRPGPIISRYAQDMTGGSVRRNLPDGTLFHGQLWTEGLTLGGVEAAYARYTEAVLPNGLRVPICMVFGEPNGLRKKNPGSKPGEAHLPRALYLEGVEWWP
jgi:serine/threonine-protein kinase